MYDVITIRASSLGALFDCPARWSAINIDGKRTPSTGKAVLGTAIHASTAVYDQSRIDGSGITIDEAVGAAVDKINSPGEDVDWGDDNQRDAEKIAISLHTKYCQQIAPTQNYKAVEIECEKLVISDLGIALTGTTDRIRKTSAGLAISDLKTGKSVVGSDGSVKTSGHAMQQGVYELLASHAIGERMSAPAQIIGMNTAKTSNSQRIGIGEIHGAMDALLGGDENEGILQMASKLIRSGMFFGNPRSMLCHQAYCPIYNSCGYRK